MAPPCLGRFRSGFLLRRNRTTLLQQGINPDTPKLKNHPSPSNPAMKSRHRIDEFPRQFSGDYRERLNQPRLVV